MLALMLLWFLADPQANRPQRVAAPPPETFFVSTLPPDELRGKQAVLETAEGVIVLDLLAEAAPNHVRQFLRLAAAGVYDGTAFHRVVRGFVAQGGHLPTRREAPSERQQAYVRMLQPEFNDTPHDRGTLSMARLEDPASASSSFFIVLARTPALDGQYTVFGRVVDGLGVLEKIEAVPLDGETPVTRIEVTGVRLVKAP